MMNEPGDFPFRPSDRNPVFYGSLDWHSCVEMFWLLVRLLKVAPEDVPAGQIRDALDARLTSEGLQAEAEFMATRTARRRNAPTGGAGRSRSPPSWKRGTTRTGAGGPPASSRCRRR